VDKVKKPSIFMFCLPCSYFNFIYPTWLFFV
jgi:hypothetical protein